MMEFMTSGQNASCLENRTPNSRQQAERQHLLNFTPLHKKDSTQYSYAIKMC